MKVAVIWSALKNQLHGWG